MSYTSHGYHIPGSPSSKTRSRHALRNVRFRHKCGGPTGLCPVCFNETVNYIISQKEDPMIETHQYQRNPFPVDAVQITAQNMTAAAEWCGGEIVKNGNSTYVEVPVYKPNKPRESRLLVGDWLLYAGRGFRCYTDKAFRDAFSLVEGAPAVMHGPSVSTPDEAEAAAAIVEAAAAVLTSAPSAPMPSLSATPKNMPRSRPGKPKRPQGRVGNVGAALQQAQAAVATQQPVVNTANEADVAPVVYGESQIVTPAQGATVLSDETVALGAPVATHEEITAGTNMTTPVTPSSPTAELVDQQPDISAPVEPETAPAPGVVTTPVESPAEQVAEVQTEPQP